MLADLPDETLMAYVDDLLDDTERTRVETMLAEDPALAARLEPFIITRDALPILFSEAVPAILPDRLVATVLTAPIGATPSAQATRQHLLARLRDALFPSLPLLTGGMALAASVAAFTAGGFLLGRISAASPPPASLIEASANGDQVMATGQLHLALETTPSGGALEQGLTSVRPVLTFRDSTGRYCREYRTAHSGHDETTGFACRQSGGGWSVAFHAPVTDGTSGETDTASGAPRGDTFTPASGESNTALDRAIDKVIARNSVIDGKDEAGLIASGWPAK